METTQEISKKDILLISVLFIILLIVSSIAIIPSWRGQFKNKYMNKERTILSTVEGRLTTEGPQIKVLKIMQNQGLLLEIYKIDTDGKIETLLTKINMEESKDGYFTFKGNATNLALSDIDGDGTLEILTPVYDDTTTPRLNIYKYNIQTESFDKLSAPNRM